MTEDRRELTRSQCIAAVYVGCRMIIVDGDGGRRGQDEVLGGTELLFGRGDLDYG